MCIRDSFVDHPEMVLGSMEEVSGRFGNTIVCLPKENTDLKELLTKAGTEISNNAKYEEIELLDDEISTIPATDDVKNFSYTIIDDEVYYRENSLFVKKEVTDKNKEKIKDYLELNDALKDVIYKQKEEDVYKRQIFCFSFLRGKVFISMIQDNGEVFLEHCS